VKILDPTEIQLPVAKLVEARRGEDDIKMNLKKMGLDGLDWINLA
jgi:hypothetical protein